MGLLSFFGDIFKPAAELVDSLHTSTEEKLRAKAELLKIQADILGRALEYEANFFKEQGATIRAEITGHSWMQRNWRPLTMLMFAYIVAHNYIVVPIVQLFGAQAPVLDLPPDLWDLLKIGIGGYVVGRSVEKIVPAALSAVKNKEST